jgi:hypothetical protein
VRKTGMSADAPIILSDDDDEPPPLADDGSRRSGLFIGAQRHHRPHRARPLDERCNRTWCLAFIALYTGRVMHRVRLLQPAHSRAVRAEYALNKYALKRYVSCMYRAKRNRWTARGGADTPLPPGRLNEGGRHSYDGPRAAKGG